jgi:hypothetical protein
MYQIINNQAVEVPDNTANCSGNLLRLRNMSVEARQAEGVYSRLDYANIQTPYADPANDRIVAPFPPEPVDPKSLPFEISKIRMRKFFQSIGVWVTIKAYIESDQDRTDDWDDATVIMSNDQTVLSAIEALSGTVELSKARLMDALWNCRPTA